MKYSKHIEKLIEIKTRHLKEEVKLRAKMSAIAINKAETTILERQEASNGKFALLKEQAGEFATKTEIKALDEKISATNRIVYIGMGIILALQFIIPLIK